MNRAVARDEVLPAALAVAREIAESAPQPVRGAKQALARSLDSSLDAQLAFEAEQQSRSYETRDLQEGIAAVREKRTPSNARFERADSDPRHSRSGPPRRNGSGGRTTTWPLPLSAR